MESKLIKVSKLKSNPNNPRLIKDDKFHKLVESIKSFPEMLDIRPIVDGSPFRQLEIVINRGYKGIVHCTFIKQNLSPLPQEIFIKNGIKKEMHSKIKTIWNSQKDNILYNYLKISGIK